MAFRIECPHCKGKAVITNSNDLSDGLKDVFVKDLYVLCLGRCGARSVIGAYFKHYVNPPQPTVMEMAKALVEQEQMKLGV
ncbi:ogr/Delta-like zinc finger family protein [Marinomonas gallaica]|uniref:ogr/Delta-like zinc finger family protein n=1 Tax=Marinomonas gallaica TaxID=1806667 RepID=UPI003CE54BF1